MRRDAPNEVIHEQRINNGPPTENFTGCRNSKQDISTPTKRKCNVLPNIEGISPLVESFVHKASVLVLRVLPVCKAGYMAQFVQAFMYGLDFRVEFLIQLRRSRGDP